MTAKIFALPITPAALARLDFAQRVQRQSHRLTHAHLMQEAFAEQELAWRRTFPTCSSLLAFVVSASSWA
jgi:hypothetical protein